RTRISSSSICQNQLRDNLITYVVSAFRGCEQITFNAETAEAAEKKCLKISLRALRALRSNVAFFHRLFRRTLPVRLKPDTTNINFVHFEKRQPAQLANLGPAMIWQQ